MARIADLEARVTADTKDAENGFDRVQKKLQSFTDGLREMGAHAIEFAAGMAGIEGIKGIFDALGEAAVGFNAHLEQSRVAWGTLLDSAAGATVMLQQLKEFAIKTPFEFQGVEDSARRLMGVGFAAKDIIPILTDVGNASAALGVGNEGINRMTLALSQMHTAGRLNAQDMLQLTNLGVPAWNILAKAMDEPIAQVRKLAQEGKITGDTMVDAFREFVQANWGNMMTAQAETFNGACSNVKDALEDLVASGFKPVFDRISSLAQEAEQFAESDSMQRWAESVATVLNRLMTALGNIPQPVVEAIAVFAGMIGILMGLGAILGGIVPLVHAVVAAIVTAVATVGWPILAVAAVVALVYATWREDWFGMRDVIESVVNWIKDALVWLVGWFADLTHEAPQLWDRLWLEIRAFTGKAVADILGFIIDFGNKVYDVMAKVFSLVGKSDMVEGWRDEFDQMYGSVQDTAEAWGEAADAAKKATNWTTGGELEHGQALLNSWGDALKSFVTPATDENANALTAEGLAAIDAAQGIDVLGGTADDAATKAQQSVGDLVQSLIALNPATAQAAAAVDYWQAQVDGANAALRGNQQALKNEQDRLQKMQDKLSSLNDKLDGLKSRLQDLSNPRLTGMGDFDMKISAIQSQLNRLNLADSLGVPLEDIIAQYPLLTQGAEDYLATLPQTSDELQALLDQLQLMRGLTYDEKLQLLQNAANPPAPEITYNQALTGINQTLTQMDKLNKQIDKQQEAVDRQQSAVKGLQRATDALNATLQDFQTQLQNAKDHQDNVNKALELAYTWFTQDRQKMIDLGGEAVTQAGVLDQKARELLDGVNQFAGDTSDTAQTTLGNLIAGFQVSSATAVAEVNANLGKIPSDIYTTHHVTTVYDNVPTPALPGRAAGGDVKPGLPYIVGENGPEIFVPSTAGTILPNGGGPAATAMAGNGDVYVIVQGSVIRERDLARSVRDELRKLGKRNVTVGLS